jgi:hypothetical protein
MSGRRMSCLWWIWRDFSREIMKFKKINKSKEIILEPRLTVGKTGIFYLNKEAIKLIAKNTELKEVELHQNEEDINKFFLKVSNKGDCKITNKRIHKGIPLSATFSFMEATRHINRHFKHVDSSKPIKFKIGEGIIIKNEYYFPLYIIKHTIVTQKEKNSTPYTFSKIEKTI